MNRPQSEHEKVKDDRFERERIRYQWMLNSLQSFRIFFAGLVFAMLSFSLQFPIETDEKLIMLLQVIGWLFLLATGLLAIKDAGGFVILHNEDSFLGLNKKSKYLMWVLFTSSLIVLMAARACSI